MELPQSSIQDLVKDVKKEMMVLSTDPYSFISPSAYDTAWLAMVPAAAGGGGGGSPTEPMFKNCLDWVVNNQKEEGFWGDHDGHGMPTIECLPATIACLVALKKWNAGDTLLTRGVSFIQEDAGDVLGELHSSCPRWFAIVFPAMLELASMNGVSIVFPDRLTGLIANIFDERRQILEQEGLVDKYQYPPLISYLEALPSNYVDEEETVKHLRGDGSIFQSPSATASAFMATGNRDCLGYLQSVAQTCGDHGVPQTFPMDEELVKLCMVNQIQKLGLGEHFNQEIEGVMEHIYRSFEKEESWVKSINSIESQLYKDSLAFWLLRMHGYSVLPGRFCWFLGDGEIEEHLRNNVEYFSSVMLKVYSASQLAFPGEPEIHMARSFSRKLLLDKAALLGTAPNFHNLIKHELEFPWIARLDHLDHRKWIEEKNNSALWMGKTSYHRLSSHKNKQLRQLAVRNYEFRQSVYRRELEDLTKWSRRWGLSHMGFGREKTAYCYFANAASTLLPEDSEVRTIGAKCGILSTVADDFYDVQGSLDELESLTKAIERWDGEGLSGHGRTIFDVLAHFVSEIGAKYLQKHGAEDITNNLRSMWSETFSAWLTEAKWSRNGFVPSSEEYLEVGTTSAAIHNMVLTPACFLNPSLPNHKLRPVPQYETITELLMLIPRLLNDIQSYEREQKEGKMNSVLIHLKENPEGNIEDSIAYIRKVLDRKEEEFLEEALMGGGGVDGFSKSCRHLHLSCAKAYHMLYSSGNRYDSDVELVKDIQDAMFIPIQIGSGQLKKLPGAIKKQSGETTPALLPSTPKSKGYGTMSKYHRTNQKKKPFIVKPTSASSSYKPVLSRNGLSVVLKCNFCFM